MKSLLLLNTSLIVNKPVLKHEKIKLEYGKNRINSYKKGFESLETFKTFNLFDHTVLFDNTLNSKNKIPKFFLNILPTKTDYVCEKNNIIGKRNKGAGMILKLQKNISYIENFDLIFYFEPRLILENISFIEEFLKNKKNLFSLEGENRVKTGYFGSTSKALIPFLNACDTEKMVRRNLHIEDLMFEYFKNKKSDFIQINTTLWKNYLTGVYEKY